MLLQYYASRVNAAQRGTTSTSMSGSTRTKATSSASSQSSCASEQSANSSDDRNGSRYLSEHGHHDDDTVVVKNIKRSSQAAAATRMERLQAQKNKNKGGRKVLQSNSSLERHATDAVIAATASSAAADTPTIASRTAPPNTNIRTKELSTREGRDGQRRKVAEESIQTRTTTSDPVRSRINQCGRHQLANHEKVQVQPHDRPSKSFKANTNDRIHNQQNTPSAKNNVVANDSKVVVLPLQQRLRGVMKQHKSFLNYAKPKSSNGKFALPKSESFTISTMDVTDSSWTNSPDRESNISSNVNPAEEDKVVIVIEDTTRICQNSDSVGSNRKTTAGQQIDRTPDNNYVGKLQTTTLQVLRSADRAFQKGTQHYKNGDFDDALKELLHVTRVRGAMLGKAHADTRAAWYSMAVTYWSLGETYRSLTIFRRLLRWSVILETGTDTENEEDDSNEVDELEKWIRDILLERKNPMIDPDEYMETLWDSIQAQHAASQLLQINKCDSHGRDLLWKALELELVGRSIGDDGDGGDKDSMDGTDRSKDHETTAATLEEADMVCDLACCMLTSAADAKRLYEQAIAIYRIVSGAGSVDLLRAREALRELNSKQQHNKIM